MIRAAAGAALLVIALAACAPPTSQPPEPTESSGLPTAAPSEAPTATATPAPSEAPTETATESLTESPGAAPPTEPPPPGQTVDIYLFREQGNGDGFWLEPMTVGLDSPTPAVAHAAMEALVAARPTEPGLANLLPEDTQVLGVDLDGRTLVVDLDLPNNELPLGAVYEAHAVSQVVHTGAQFPTVRRVQVLEEGRTLPSGHYDWSGSIKADQFDVVPIDITEPAYGATVPAGDVTFGGTANTFEATVELRLRNPDGDVVQRTFATATCGTGCRGDWKHTFSLAEAGTWTVVAVEPDPSGGEGRPPFRVATTVTVQ